MLRPSFQHGADILLTDQKGLLRLLQHNVAKNLKSDALGKAKVKRKSKEQKRKKKELAMLLSLCLFLSPSLTLFLTF
jgi:hypothetical protein